MASIITFPKDYDIIVIGGGHAGCEAALASSRMGCSVLLLTMNLDTIAQMSCNPAIGGLSKGHIVREIDALGGEMGKATDRTGIQFRMLNTKKGPAVWSPRAQVDKKAYQYYMKWVMEREPNLDIKQELVEKLDIEEREYLKKVTGVITRTNMRYRGRAVIITTGTFLNGLIHIGETSYPAGRQGEFPAVSLSENLREIGFEIRRLKTGTPPRINKNSIDSSQLSSQNGDEKPVPFSFSTRDITEEQVPCFVTYTNEKTHDLILKNLDRSPLYAGRIKGIGPRYCPSIEDKVVRFPQRGRHQIFLEPEGRTTEEIYLNGVSTSLPQDVQIEFIRTIKGLENSEVMRFGYAIEYDFVPPSQLKPTQETKLVENLYLAGQINGTSGYEEAACQGLVAGINSVLKLRGEEPFVLGRQEAYIGVLIDDLVTKGTNEPYRMFLSRAEYRLLLRHDNADLRLMKYSRRFGLIPEEDYKVHEEKWRRVNEEIARLRKERAGNVTLAKLLQRPDMGYYDLPCTNNGNNWTSDMVHAIETEIKYEGYIKRELARVEKYKKLEDKPLHPGIDYALIPLHPGIDYALIKGLRTEAKEKLQKIMPDSIGQANRIPGVSPCDISAIMIYMERERRMAGKN
ncbi:MAG: tRNA uridine-5-carboxymethylaminomethyl(34) synthesis enzyme MnmG [Candidatus Omnitrophica bacterium]|nr:tRNA uridine-5-carboxymethylaminomethyl(34) synthesis enzyme MnmG [Candidatus Omnitrophota bacterium]